MIKGLLLLLFILIFFFLARGLFLIIKHKGASKKPLHALMWRIGLSMTVLLGILWAFHMGWLHPNPTGVHLLS